MDAAENLLKKTALFLVAALVVLTASVAHAQTLVANPTSLVLNSNQAKTVAITASDGSAVGFTVTSKPNWVFVSANPATTPSTLTVQISNDCSGSCPAGEIVLTPALPNATAPLHIPVSFNLSGGGGSSGLTVSTSSVPLSVVNGGSASSSVTVSSTSGAAVTFTTTTSPANSWLTCTQGSNQVASGSPTTLNIFASGAGYANTTLNGSCTLNPSTGGSVVISVTFTIGSSSSGTIQVNQNNLNFNYPCGFCSTTVGVTSSTTTTFNMTVSSTNSWLSANNQVSGTTNQAVSGGIFLQVNNNAAALGTGTYTGTVVLTNPNNASDTTTLLVNLSVNGATGSGVFSPSSLSFSGNLNDAPKSQNVTISASLGSVSAATSACSWVGVTQTTTANLFTVTVIPSAFAFAGTYNCNVVFTINNVIYNLPITLTLGGAGGGGTSGGVAPSSLTFSGQAGAANSPQFQQVTVTGSGPIAVSTSYGTGSTAFISATASGAAPGYVFVYVTSGLGVGTYSGTLGITVNGNTQQIPVTYNVSSGVALIASPSTINVSSDNGGSIAPTTLSLSASDNSNLPVTVQSSTSWVTISSGTTSSTPANFLVNINPTGLPNGINSATITVNAPGAANNPMTIPVVLLVNGSGSGGGTGNLTLSASTLTFNTNVGGGNPTSQFLTVNGPNGVATNFFVSATTSNCGGAWLSASPTGNLTTPQTLTVSAAAPTGTAAQCTGTISLTSGGQTQTVQVIENVGTGGGGSTGNVTVITSPATNPPALTFTYQQGSSTTPAAQVLQVNSASGTAGVGFNITTTTTSGGSWLSAGGTSSTTPTTLPINVNVTGLAAGTYNGNIAISPNGGTVVNVPVTLTIQSLAVSAAPPTLSFSYRAGDAAPQNQTITVSGATGLTFSATASSNGDWLSVSPTTGTTAAGGNTLQVAISPTNLSAGTYNGTITVAGTGTATGSTTINVTLTVTAPLPTITKVTNAASYAANGISAGQIITIFGNNMGPGTLVVLSKLEADGKVGTTLGGVQVLVNGYPAPILYVRNDQISVITPYEIASPFLANPNVVVKYLGQSSNGFPMNQVAAAPGIFTANQSGTGPGAILNANNSVNSASNPAAKGSIVQVFLTGEGQTSPAGVTGSVSAVSINTPKPLLPVAVLVDGQPAGVTFFGEAPGLVAGVLQVNVTIPQNARTGDLPIQISLGSNQSQTGVTVSVR